MAAQPRVNGKFYSHVRYKSLWCPKCKGPVSKGGGSRGKQRYCCFDRKVCKWHGIIPGGKLKAERSRGVNQEISAGLKQLVLDRKVHRFVITCAQNATSVHKPFFKSLKSYCRLRKARLIVIPYRYKNPTSFWSKTAGDDDWWAEELTPYLLDIRVPINQNLILLADIKTQPTAESPLTGFETMTGGLSAIVGHPKLELITVPTPQQSLPKVITTTGAVTRKNYIPSKAGKRGEHHHTFAAALVEVRGELFHLRQLVAQNDGTFMDLLWKYSPEGRIKVKDAVQALVMGDSHVEFIDPGVVKATFTDRDSLVNLLKPKYLVWHDVHDFYARNHHERNDVFINYVKHHTGTGNVEKWLDHTFRFIDAQTRPGITNVLIPSNHPNDHFRRWVNETDPRDDPENCVFWARTFEAMCLNSRMTASGVKVEDPFIFWAKRKLKKAAQAIFLEYDEPMQVRGIEIGFHGHLGANGMRGTIRSYGKVGVKSVIGHAHTPGIKNGVCQVGTSSLLRLSYNHGLSSWMHTHALIYSNGKRSLVNIVKEKWHA